MTLANAPKSDEPYVMVTISLVPGCQLAKKCKTISSLRAAFPAIRWVSWDPESAEELKKITSVRVAGPSTEVEKLAKKLRE